MCKIDFFGGNFCLKYFNGILQGLINDSVLKKHPELLESKSDGIFGIAPGSQKCTTGA